MSLLIPLRADLDAYVERVSLDGVDYDLAFRWNERDQQYYMSIFSPDSPTQSDGSRVALVAGVPILVGTPFLRSVPGLDRPLGEFIALDTSGQMQEAGQRDLGARVILVYVPLAEIPAGYPNG